MVRELFANAEHSVTVAGYAVFQGQHVFRALADRMVDYPQLRVKLFLNVERSHGDASSPTDILQRFAARFVASQWPAGSPLPAVYYYAKSLNLGSNLRTSLHAKCVVVDDHLTFVSSANFTEAAHERNIEVGILVRSTLIAKRLSNHFEHLVEEGDLLPVHLEK